MFLQSVFVIIEFFVFFISQSSSYKDCPPLKTQDSTFVYCRYRDEAVNCTEEAVADTTIAYFSCANFHELPPQSKNISYCWDGTWDIPKPICKPVCGVKGGSTRKLRQVTNSVSGGNPWTVGIYKTENKEFICSGSLISERAIVTTAHCVSDNRDEKRDESFFTVTAGKHHLPFDDPRDANAQYAEIENIYVPNRYKGSKLNYQSDIAVLVTKEAFNITKSVQRVCVDWNRNSDFENNLPGTNGIVTGWGYKVQTEEKSEILKEITLPYVEFNQCFEDLPEYFRKYITSDKMCAGYLNKGIGVCVGDSGGGLVFKNQKDSRYYLRGILGFTPNSHTGVCDGNNYALSTKISSHLDFLNDVLRKSNTE